MRKKKNEVPDWTEPEYLNQSDWMLLKRIKHLYEQGNMQEAMYLARFTGDTVIREEIPPGVWVAMGGTLTKTGEEKLRALLKLRKAKKISGKS